MIGSHIGGEHVSGGLYWCSSSAEFVSIPSEGGRLEGGPGDRYMTVPLPLVLTMGPLMGLAFIVFLPLSGLLVLVPFLLTKMRGAMGAGGISVAQATSGAAQPGISYLEPRLRSRGPEGSPRMQAHEGPHEGKLFDLAREIAEKRWKER